MRHSPAPPLRASPSHPCPVRLDQPSAALIRLTAPLHPPPQPPPPHHHLTTTSPPPHRRRHRAGSARSWRTRAATRSGSATSPPSGSSASSRPHELLQGCVRRRRSGCSRGPVAEGRPARRAGGAAGVGSRGAWEEATSLAIILAGGSSSERQSACNTSQCTAIVGRRSRGAAAGAPLLRCSWCAAQWRQRPQGRWDPPGPPPAGGRPRPASHRRWPPCREVLVPARPAPAARETHAAAPRRPYQRVRRLHAVKRHDAEGPHARALGSLGLAIRQGAPWGRAARSGQPWHRTQPR